MNSANKICIQSVQPWESDRCGSTEVQIEVSQVQLL